MMDAVRFNDPSLGRFLHAARAFCAIARADVPQVACREIRRVDTMGTDGLTVRFVSDRFDGGGAVRLSEAAALYRLEALLGGQPTLPPARRLTPLEQSLARPLVTPLLRAWEHAWNDAVSFSPLVGEGLPPRGPFIEWRMGAADVVMDEALAHALLHEAGDRTIDQTLLRHAVLETRARLDARIGGTRLTLGEVTRLQPGSLITLTQHVEKAWPLETGGFAVAHARPATVGGQPHLVVTETRTFESEPSA